ncbi:MAG: hypothetical protein A2Z25_14810 [Planctomycetes bacterium RBG_16_55_9]|nr:MAG: hypothetical protein A2Z25_14810 [Planctomycetes bacterium RBG_16_55_9]
MRLAVDKDNILEDVVASYETRIQSMEGFFQAAGHLFQDFQDSLFNTRAERIQINDQLRENLARNGSLRKKDFDRMMGVISSHLDHGEKEVRQLSQQYLDEQTRLVQQLKEGLSEFKDALIAGQGEKVQDLQTLIRSILSQQDQNKNEVASKLKELQHGQQQTSKMLRDLLAKGEELRIRDFKAMLAEFKRQRAERIAGQERRRRQVKDMLSEFKAKRTETEQDKSVEQQEGQKSNDLSL